MFVSRIKSIDCDLMKFKRWKNEALKILLLSIEIFWISVKLILNIVEFLNYS